MFSLGRLLTFGIFAFLVYMGFYAVPCGMAGPSDFDPEEVARHEVATWRAALVREELPTFMSGVLEQRERQGQNRQDLQRHGDSRGNFFVRGQIDRKFKDDA